MRFPQLGSDANVVSAVVGDELITANLYPVFRLRHAGGVLCIDAEAERRSPEEVRHEPHAAAVVREDPRARSLEPLLRHHSLVGLTIEVRLHDPVWPEDLRDVDARASAQPEMYGLACEDLSLCQQPTANLDGTAHTKGVDPLVTSCGLCLGSHHLPVVALRTTTEKSDRLSFADADQIELAVPVHIGDAEDIGRYVERASCEIVVRPCQPNPCAP